MRAKRAAILGIVAFIDVPIVHMSVEWWRTLHQKPTVLRPDLNPEIDGLMLFTLFVGVVAFTLVYCWLMLHKNRVLMMEAALEDHELRAGHRRAPGRGGAVVSAVVRHERARLADHRLRRRVRRHGGLRAGARSPAAASWPGGVPDEDKPWV